LSDFALRLGLALVVVTVACAAIIISRRNYAKSADSERSLGAFRLEFQRSIDAAQAATIKTIRDNIFSVIKTINSTIKDLNGRLARLEERADETATHFAGAQNLEVHLARLEQHLDATATYTENLDARLARLEERADGTATQIAGTQNLEVRLARLEERANETATQIAGTQNLDVRLTRLEERADETATQIAGTENLDVRLARLEERADEAATHMAGNRKQSLEQTERIATQLAGHEQNLTELSDRLSLIKQTIDGATLRDQDTHNSIEAISSRVVDTQQRMEELFPRQVLGEKALKDLGTLIGFFIKRLKTVNASSTEIAARLGDLESQFRSKLGQLEERHSSILERKDGLATSKIEDLVEDATAKAADAAIPIAATTDGKNADGFERATTPGQESSKKTIVEEEGHADNSRADQHAT
jgi:predicted  nucleic acid-binding Zn-ribbon protein